MVESQLELGKLYQIQHKLEEAEEILRVAVRSQPQNVTALYRLAQVLQSRGLAEEAKTHFERVRALQEESHAQPMEALRATEEGINALDQGRLEEAVLAFQKAQSLDPTDLRADLLGRALFREGKTQEAIDCFRTATRMRPAYLNFQIDLAKALKSVNDPSADEEWHKVELLSASLTPNGPEKSLTVEAAIKQYNSAVALMQQRKSEAALNALQAAIKLEPNLERRITH